FSRTRFEQLPTVSLFGTDQRTETAAAYRQIFLAARKTGNQGNATRNAFLALARQGWSVLLCDSRSSNFPAGKVSRCAALRHVRPGFERNPRDVLSLQYSRAGR